MKTTNARGFSSLLMLRKEASSKRPSPGAYGRGVVALSRNARRLFDDAVALKGAKRYESAIALSILALEEMEKAVRLLPLTLLKDQREVEREWHSWRRRHTSKLRSAIRRVLQRPASGTERERGWKYVRGLHEHADRMKERMLYVEFLKGDKWSEPRLMGARALCAPIMAIVLVFMTTSAFSWSTYTELLEGDKLPKDGMTPFASRLAGWARSGGTGRVKRESGEFMTWLLERTGAKQKKAEGN